MLVTHKKQQLSSLQSMSVLLLGPLVQNVATHMVENALKSPTTAGTHLLLLLFGALVSCWICFED
jgi:hypothetical protein